MTSKQLILGGVVTALLVIGIVVSTFLTQNKQTYQSRAAGQSIIELKTPQFGQSISAITAVEAIAQTNEDIRRLNGVFKINGQAPKTLNIKRVDANTINLTGAINNNSYSEGSHTLEIFLYSLASGHPELIGSTDVQLIIKRD